MKIDHVKIDQILGIAHLEFDAGQFVQIEGENGTGKTSVLEAIKEVIKGDFKDATLLRNGAKKGEIVLVLDDGTSIRKSVTERGAYTTVTDAAGKKMDRPQEYIKRLTDLLSVNPVEFLSARPKDRVNIMLESITVTADAARLTKIVGNPVAIEEGRHALDQIDGLFKSIFDDRTGTNRAISQKEASIAQLTSTLPSTDIVPEEGAEALEAQLREIDEAKAAEMTRIAEKLALLRTQSDARITEVNAAIEGLRHQIMLHQETIAAERNSFAAVQTAAGTQREKKTAAFDAQREPLVGKISTIRANADAASRATHTRELIDGMKREADELVEDRDRQTKSLEGLTAYKAELLSALPIAGLEVRDGEVFCDGVPFDRLNTERQVELAVEIAKLRAGDLGIICVDRIESLDTAHFEAFKVRAMESGLQLFVTRVADSAFNIVTA